MYYHPLYWNNIVYMHWHEIEYKLGTWRSFVLGWWDVKIVIWARGDCSCESCLILWKWVEIVRTDTWRSSVSVYGHRESHMGHKLSIIINEYHVYTIERVPGIMIHIISWYHIALHFITSHSSLLMIVCFIWWLESSLCWLALFDETGKCNIDLFN